MASERGASLRNFRLLWAASVLIPALMFAATASWTWQSIEAETRARLERTIDMLHEHALRSFETQEAILEAVNQHIRSLGAEAMAASHEVHEFLREITQQAQPSGGTIVIGRDNRIINSSTEFPTQRTDLSDRDYVRALRGGHYGTHIGEVVAARPTNTTVFSMSRRSSDGDALIVSSFKPGYFETFYASVAETPGDSVALVREDGAVLARVPPPGNVTQYAERFYRSLFREVFAKGRIFAKTPSPSDGKTRYYAYRQVGDYPVLVTYGLDASALNAAWLRQLAVSGTVCLIAALLLTIFTLLAQRSVRRERAALASARAEAERRADAEERLRHSQRIDALGQIVGGVAHDFNNVVMAVMAGARTIEKRIDDPAEIRRIVALIDAAANRGGRLTSRMLAFARREDSRTDAVEVREALQSVADLLGHTLGSGYQVKIEQPEHLPLARGDRTEFETAIVNLVINARDAMPDGGVVTITAGEETIAADGASEVPGIEPGRYIRITVVDSGTGMDEETLARAGEAFFTTKAPGKGTGLGLAMAWGFAENAGGALRIDSEPGRGTTVTLWLAAADG